MLSTNYYDMLKSATDNDGDSTTTPASRPSSPSSSNPYSLPPRVMSWADETEEELVMEKAAAAAKAEASGSATDGNVAQGADRWETLGRARQVHQLVDGSAEGSVDAVDRGIIAESSGVDTTEDYDDEEYDDEEYVAEEYHNSEDDIMIPVDDQGEEVTEGYIDDVPLTTLSEGDATSADQHDAFGLAQAELRTYPKSEPAPATDTWETFTSNLPEIPSPAAPSSPVHPTTDAAPEPTTATERPETPDELKGMDPVARYWWSKPVTDTPVADSWNEYVARFPEHCKRIGMRPLTPEGSGSPLKEEKKQEEDEDEDEEEKKAGATEAPTKEAQSGTSAIDAGDAFTKQPLKVSSPPLPPTEPLAEAVDGKESSEVLQGHIPATEPVELPPSPNASTEEVKPSGRASDSWDDFVAQTPVVWATKPVAVATDDNAAVAESSPHSSPPDTLPHASITTAFTPPTASMPVTPLKDSVSTPSSPPEVMSSPLHETVDRLKKPSIFTLDGQRDQSPASTPTRLTATKSTLSRLEEVDEEEHEVTAGAEDTDAITDTVAQRSQTPPKTFVRHASARRELEKAAETAVVETTQASPETEAVVVKSEAETQQAGPAKRSRKSKRKTKRAGKAAAGAEVSSPKIDMQTTAESTTHAEDLQETSFESAAEDTIITDSEATMVATPISEPEVPTQVEAVRQTIYDILGTESSTEDAHSNIDVAVVNDTSHDDDHDEFVDAQEDVEGLAEATEGATPQPKKSKKSRTKAQRRRAAEAQAAQTHSSVLQTPAAALSRDQETLRRREQRKIVKPTINVRGDANFITVTPTITTGDRATFDFGMKSDKAAHPIKKTMRARAEDLLMSNIRIGGYTVPWPIILLVVGLLYGDWLIAHIAG